ncbi:MAG: TRAP transporter small permease [Synergistaceae bacterium]|nr:TRAP transporter small permease [Synergistaceae bacterium]
MREIQFINSIMDSEIWKSLLKVQRFIMFLTTVLMLVILGAVVLARYVLHADLYGYDEIVLVDSFWMYFIGAAYAMSKEEHIKADILATMMGEKLLAVAKLAAGILQTSINFIFVVLAYNMVARSIETWTVTSLWNIPYFIPQTAILLSFVITALYLTVYTIRDYNHLVALTRKG